MNEDHDKMKRLLEDVVHDEGYRTWREGLRRALDAGRQARSRMELASKNLFPQVVFDLVINRFAL